jgi:polyhydroxyalkanoate synthase
VLLIPSLINRWYVLDLRPTASLAKALVDNGLDVYCLDWGCPEDEDRYVTWDDVLARISRMVRFVRRKTGSQKVSLLGYCIGGTLSGIHSAREPESVAGLINLAGPFDFSKAGFMAEMTNPAWFDVGAISEAGNVSPAQMQAGFIALRPTNQLSKIVALMDRGLDPEFKAGFDALDGWANDNIPFPAAAYQTYITELYQQNRLVKGEHAVAGSRIQLSNIQAPVLTITAERDTICPPGAALALNELAGSKQKDAVQVPGGHVGAVVGSRASSHLYPKIADWLKARTCN